MTLPNQTALATDPRTRTPLGFGGVWFRRVFVDPTTGAAPDWIPQVLLVKKLVPNGNPVYQQLGRDADTLALDVEVDTVADAVALRALVGTAGNLTLPDARYGSSDYGTARAYSAGDGLTAVAYRTQTARLVGISASAITIRGTVRLSLSLERNPS